jgi:predicted DNA-binding protein YlxM (UPF0122 family)
MVLTEPYSKKYDAVIRFKQSILMDKPESTKIPITPARRVNEYGEVEVGRTIQDQKHLTEDEITLLLCEYKTGKSTYALAEQFGCHRSTISNALKKHGIKVTHCKSQEKLNISDAIAMYENLHTAQEIADKYNVTRQMVAQTLRAHSVRIRGRWDY